MPRLWRLSTDEGASLSGDELVAVLETHHSRVVDGWQHLSAEQWAGPSRNTGWSVHDTARHVADAMETCCALVRDEPSRFVFAGFNPLETPDEWIAESADEPPVATIERFVAAAGALREGVRERAAADDASRLPTPYGPAHWTMNVVHVFWDSWLHERDVLLPLRLPAESSTSEERLVGLYGLLMALVPARLSEQPLRASVRFEGTTRRDVEAAHEAGRLSSAERSGGQPDLRGDVGTVIDAFSGRGLSVADALPGAPEELGVLAAYFNS